MTLDYQTIYQKE